MQNRRISLDISTKTWSYEKCKEACAEEGKCVSFDYCSCPKGSCDELCFLKTKWINESEQVNEISLQDDKKCFTSYRVCKFSKILDHN